MRCLRCAHCCFTHSVVIVDDPALGPVEGNLIARGGDRCQHLRGDTPGQFSCAIHDEPWYPETPCAQHGQIEYSPDDPCRLGVFVMKTGLPLPMASDPDRSSTPPAHGPRSRRS